MAGASPRATEKGSQVSRCCEAFEVIHAMASGTSGKSSFDFHQLCQASELRFVVTRAADPRSTAGPWRPAS